MELENEHKGIRSTSEIISRSKGRRDKRRKLSWRQCDNMARRSRTNKMRV